MAQKKREHSQLKKWLLSKKKWVILGLIFLGFIFLHVYQFEERMSFGWDQVDNAWAAQQILVAHDYPLLGMVAKGNSGFHIGPAYYYLISPIYFIFNMSPISSGVIALLSSILTFFVIFFVTRKLFSTNIALIAVFINTVSSFILRTDRTQWPVNFIIPISLLVFYTLYKVVAGNSRYLIPLALVLGVSLHIHFTSVFYFVAVLLALPFFPRKKGTIYHILISIPLFAVWLIPSIYTTFATTDSQGLNMAKYLQENYHGLHATRVFQMLHDAFIEFNLILKLPYADFFVFLLPPIFAIVYFAKKRTRNRLLFIYLMALWFLIPWISLSTFRGEITNYYFYMTRPMVLLVLAYLTHRVFMINNLFPKVAIVLFWTYFTATNIQDFLQVKKDFKIDCTQHTDAGAQRVNTSTSYLNYYCTHHYKK